MIAKDDLLTNFTDAGLKMCVGEFGQKRKKIISVIRGINYQPITSKKKDQRARLIGSHEKKHSHVHEHIVNPR